MEIVDNESDIILDIFLVSARVIEEVTDFSDYSALDHYYRGQDIFSFYNTMNDYNSSMILHPDVEYRHVIFPTQKLSKTPLDIIGFNQKVIDRCFEAGQKDAKISVTLGSGVYGSVLLEFTERFKNGENPVLHDMIQEKLDQKLQQ